MKPVWAGVITLGVTGVAGTATFLSTGDETATAGVSGALSIIGLAITVFTALNQKSVQTEIEARTAQDEIKEIGREATRAARAEGATTRTALEDGFKRVEDKISEEVAHEVVDEWERRGHHTAALKPDTIIALARKIPDGGQDLDTLVKDLITALDAAEDLIAQGTHKTNLDQFAEAVFARVAERTAANDFDGAADAARAGFEDWQTREAERAEASKQTGLAILETRIKAETSRSNARGVALAEIDQLRLQHSEDLHDHVRERRREYYVEGRDKDQRFPLLVSIEIATLALETAQTLDQRGAILNDLGNALATLGERESGAARLGEAVTAFRHALEEYTRKRVPLKWAITQNNLGNTLSILGQRESGTARLEEAVTAYRHALEEFTQDRVPLQWARTQNNLGAALRALGERESGTARLEEAVTAYRHALEEWTRDRVPLDWAMTQYNLGMALFSIGQRGDDDALLQAIACYRRALLERREDNAPYYHRRTMHNLNHALALAEERGLDVPDETVPD